MAASWPAQACAHTPTYIQYAGRRHKINVKNTMAAVSSASCGKSRGRTLENHFVLYDKHSRLYPALTYHPTKPYRTVPNRTVPYRTLLLYPTLPYCALPCQMVPYRTTLPYLTLPYQPTVPYPTLHFRPPYPTIIVPYRTTLPYHTNLPYPTLHSRPTLT